MRLFWLAQARADRSAIIEYVALDNPAAAIENDERITAQADRLLEYPEIGRRGRVQGTRELVIVQAPYLAIYRQSDDVIEILRVLHQRQAWPPLKQE